MQNMKTQLIYDYCGCFPAKPGKYLKQMTSTDIDLISISNSHGNSLLLDVVILGRYANPNTIDVVYLYTSHRLE